MLIALTTHRGDKTARSRNCWMWEDKLSPQAVTAQLLPLYLMLTRGLCTVDLVEVSWNPKVEKSTHKFRMVLTNFEIVIGG